MNDEFLDNEDNEYVVNHFDEMGNDNDECIHGLEEAVEFLRERQTFYNEQPFYSLCASPTLAHPSGDGREYDLDEEDFV